MLLASAPVLAFQTTPAIGSVPAGMVLISGGEYVPLYNSPDGEEAETVADFYMDADPVTNRAFLEFVVANSRWRRSEISRLFADEAYLRHWAQI